MTVDYNASKILRFANTCNQFIPVESSKKKKL